VDNRKNKLISAGLIICVILLIGPKLINMIAIARYDGFYLEKLFFAYDSATEEEVHDEAAARQIAENVWIRVYGEEVKDEKPYEVKYDSVCRVWIVRGSLPKASEGSIVLGGTAGIIIQKSDGKVIDVWHDK